MFAVVVLPLVIALLLAALVVPMVDLLVRLGCGGASPPCWS